MAATPISDIEQKLIKKAAIRIVPFVMLAYLISYIDRVNIGFASLQMNDQVHLTSTIFGLGGGLYFIAYVLFEVPSNLLIDRSGVRLFMMRIMILWGLITCAMAWVVGVNSFLTLRVLLGVAEAGLFPGIILYLTFWFPRAYRARYLSWFTLAIPLSGLIGAPISAALLQMDKVLGFAGWQWLFVMEGLPAVLMGIVAYFYVADHPKDGRWMTAEERQIYSDMLARDELENNPNLGPKPSLWKILANPTVLGLAVVLSASSAVSNTLAVWLPRYIKSFGVTTSQTGWLTAAPYLLGAIIILVAGYSSDRFKERIWHTALPLYVSAGAFLLMLVWPSDSFGYAMIVLVILGIYFGKSPTWAVATEWLPNNIRTAGFAQVNTVSSLISFFPIYLIGYLRDHHHSFAFTFQPMGVISFVGATLILIMSAARGRSVKRASKA